MTQPSMGGETSPFGALIEMCIRDRDHIVQSHPVEEAMLALKDFMFASVYTNPLAKGEEGKAQNMLCLLYTSRCV